MNSSELDTLHILALGQLVSDMRDAEEADSELEKDHYRSRAQAYREVIEEIDRIKLERPKP